MATRASAGGATPAPPLEDAPGFSAFVTAQEHLAALPPDGDLAASEIAVARTPEDKAWSARLAELRLKGASTPKAFVSFPRGGALHLNVAAAHLAEHARVIFASYPVEGLAVRLGAKDGAAFAGVEELARVTDLTLFGAGRAVVESLRSPHLKRLRALTLVDVTDKTLAALGPVLDGAPFALDELDVRVEGDVDHAAEVVASLLALAGLTRFAFRSKPAACGAPFHQGPKGAAPLLGRGMRALAASTSLAGVQRLWLDHLDDAESARALAAAPWTRLTHLVVGDIDEEAGPVLCASDRLAGLVHMSLRYLGRRGLAALVANPAARGLRSFFASGSLQVDEPLGDDALQAVAASPHLQGLHTLGASDWHVGARGLRALEGGVLPHLARLDLAGGELDRAAFEVLGASTGCAALTTLRLGIEDFRLRDGAFAPALRALLEGPIGQRATRLDLGGRHREAGDEVVDVVVAARSPSLRVLGLGTSNMPSLTNAGAAALLGASTALQALELVYGRAADGYGAGVTKAALKKLRERILFSEDSMPFSPPGR